MSSEGLLEINDTNFDDVALKAPLPVLIDFTAAWCPPCRAIAPHIAAIARDYAGRLTVATCDTDSNVELAARLDVRAIPTLLLFRAGQAVGQIVGAVPKAKIEALVAKAL